eukprot:364290-Chlamydomonas_euryale.AAC.6
MPELRLRFAHTVRARRAWLRVRHHAGRGKERIRCSKAGPRGECVIPSPHWCEGSRGGSVRVEVGVHLRHESRCLLRPIWKNV